MAMNFFGGMPSTKQLLFVAVLAAGAVIWWFGAHHFVKPQPASADASDSPYEVEDMQIIPVEPSEPVRPFQPVPPFQPKQ